MMLMAKFVSDPEAAGDQFGESTFPGVGQAQQTIMEA